MTMSFSEARSELTVCNKALSKIYQAPLVGSLDDPANVQKLAGRECRRWYKAVVRQLLERHHFGLATKRQALIGVVNDRSAEWSYAYAKPNDMAFPVAILPSGAGAASQISYYQGVGFLLGMLYGRPVFRYEGGIIYSQIGSAEIDYVSFDITEADFTESFEHLVVLFLAAALAEPIAKDRTLAKDIKNEAVVELNQIIAQSLNQNSPRYGDFTSEAELARGSAPVDTALMGWRY